MPFRDNNRYLDELKVELLQLNTSLLHICANYTDRQLNWNNSTNKWSVLQHLEHIYLHNVSFIEKSFHSISNLPQRPDTIMQKPFRPSSTGSLYINSISVDSQLKMRALPSFVPSEKLDRSATLSKLKASTEKMLKLIEESRKINLNSIRLRIPGCNLLFYLGDVLQIIVQHTKRHQKQIIDLAIQPAFPKK